MYTSLQGKRESFLIRETVIENRTPGEETAVGWDLQQRYDQSRRHDGRVAPGYRRPPSVGNVGRKITPSIKSSDNADLSTSLPECRIQ